MNSIGTNLQNDPSPFRFDSAPQGEADVALDQISVADGKKQKNDGWGADGFTFGDILDVLNPLQHIPVVSSIYRAITGDEIAAAPRAIGGALFGGPVGLIVAISNQVVEAENGSGTPSTALAMLSSRDGMGPETAAPGTFLQPPSQAGGLFAVKDRQVSPTTTRKPAPSIQPFGAATTLQSAPVAALDRLIARSQANANTDAYNSQAAVGQPTAGPSVPTDPQKVRQWILRALGKYETMPKGGTDLEGRHP